LGEETMPKRLQCLFQYLSLSLSLGRTLGRSLGLTTSLAGACLLVAACLLSAGEASAHPLEVADPAIGHLREVIFPSPSFGDVSLLVYTPPGYFAAADTRRFPVIYWLHGSGANHLQLEPTLAALPVAGTGGAGKLDTLIGQGSLPPLMMVSIAAPGGNWTDALLELVTEEVPAFVDASYRTIAKRSGRGIEGFSLGSQGLSTYATARPDLYASISLVAGAFLSSRWTAAAPALLREGSEVFISVGEADPVLAQTLAFESQLTGLGIPHTLVTVPGVGHNNTGLYAARGIDILAWHAARFAATSFLDAGADQQGQQGLLATFTLEGTLNDPQGQLGLSPTFSWTEVSGPSTAILDTPSALSTEVHLSALGTYYFRLEAQGNFTVFDIVRVRVLDLQNGLAMYLPLDLDLQDVSGNGHHGSAAGGPILVPGGRSLRALAFDGVDDQLTVADFTYGPGFSLSLWLKAADLSGSNYQYIFSHNGFDAAPSCNLYLPETTAVFQDPGILEGGTGEGDLAATARTRLALRDSVGDLAGQAITAETPTLDNGGWHHAAIVVTPGTGHKIYFDDLEVGSGPHGGDAYDPVTALFFGARSVTPAGRYFEGTLDEIRLYARPLLREEITLLAAPEITNTAPIVAAGSDRFTYLGAPLLLQGLAADTTPTGILNVAWSQTSGPGTTFFADPAAAETSATYSRAGTYGLRLEASDGDLTAHDDLTVTVAAESMAGLVAQWTFDEGAGSLAADRSGLAHQGTLFGPPSWITPARIGPGGLHFTAAELNYVRIDASGVLDFAPATDSFTVAAWLRLAAGKEGTILARGSSDAASRAIHLQSRDLGADGRSDLVAIVGGLTNNNAQGLGSRFDDNAWHHIALVHDAGSSQNQLYLDGNALGAPAPSGSATSSVDLLIGARRASANTGAAFALDGDLDDVRIYSRALAPAEVSLLFTGPTIPPCGEPLCLFGDGFELGDTSAWAP